MVQPVAPAQGVGLPPALLGPQSQVRIDQMQLLAINLNRHPERPARFNSAAAVQSGQSSGFYEPHRKAAEHGVAVLLLFERDRRVEMKLHLELLRDRVGLIDGLRSLAAN